METYLEKLRLIEYKIDKISKEYFMELKHLSEEKGFNVDDMYWDKQLDKLSKQYAKRLYPLQTEHDKLRQLVDAKYKNEI